MDIKWARPLDNITEAEAMIATAPQTDLYVLPEMWATGFAATSPAMACHEAPLQWMQRTANNLGAAVCGGIVVRETDGTFRNRLCFVSPCGHITHYDKRHLFTYGGEHLHYTPGSHRVIATYGGLRFLLLMCYDLRFPVWARYRGDYDAIIIAANWPECRQGAWRTLLRARAIENQCYVIGANRTGSDPVCKYAGQSAIIDPKGDTLAEAEGPSQQCLTADISAECLLVARKKFPVLKDRDTISNSNIE